MVALFGGSDGEGVVAHLEEVRYGPQIGPLAILIRAGYTHEETVDENLQRVVGEPAVGQVVLHSPTEHQRVSHGDGLWLHN